eukprot:Hpha_TRINITY_DN9360_c0_g1::TRINITY_DN9360_c0_g1_i1::g.26063::m.26063
MRTLSPQARAEQARAPVLSAAGTRSAGPQRERKRHRPLHFDKGGGHRDPLATLGVNPRVADSQAGGLFHPPAKQNAEEVERLLRAEIDSLTGMIQERGSAERGSSVGSVAGWPHSGTQSQERQGPSAQQTVRGWPQPHSHAQPSITQASQSSTRAPTPTRLGSGKVSASTAPPGLGSCAELGMSPQRLGGGKAMQTSLRGYKLEHSATAPQHPLRLRRTPQCTPPIRRLLVPSPQLPNPVPTVTVPPPASASGPPRTRDRPSSRSRPQHRTRSASPRGNPRQSAPATGRRLHPPPCGNPAPRAPSAQRRSLSAPPALVPNTVDLRVRLTDLLDRWSSHKDQLSEAAGRFLSPQRRTPDGSGRGTAVTSEGGEGEESYLNALMQQSREMKRELDRHQLLSQQAAESAQRREAARRKLAARSCARLRGGLLLLKSMTEEQSSQSQAV